MEPRKIIQIAITDETIFALCDDGTVWYRIPRADVWIKLKNDVPQPWEKEVA